MFPSPSPIPRRPVHRSRFAALAVPAATASPAAAPVLLPGPASGAPPSSSLVVFQDDDDVPYNAVEQQRRQELQCGRAVQSCVDPFVLVAGLQDVCQHALMEIPHVQRATPLEEMERRFVVQERDTWALLHELEKDRRDTAQSTNITHMDIVPTTPRSDKEKIDLMYFKDTEARRNKVCSHCKASRASD